MYMHIHCVHKFVASNDFLLKNMNEFSHFYLVCYTHDMYCQDENNVKNVQHHISARKGKPTMSLKSTSHRYVFFLYRYIYSYVTTYKIYIKHKYIRNIDKEVSFCVLCVMYTVYVSHTYMTYIMLVYLY